MKILSFIFFIFFGNLFIAQNVRVVHGKFNGNNRTIELSKETKRLFFVKTKGNFRMPERAFFLELSSGDIKKFGTDYIVIIPLNGEENAYYSTSEKEITLEVLPLTSSDPFVYYTKINSIDNEVKIPKNIFENPTKKDTLSWDVVNNYETLHHSKEWIDHLDDQRKITVQGTQFAMYTDGTCNSSAVYDYKTIAEFAKQQLHYVANLFDEIDEENWIKKQWQDWYEKTVDYKEPILSECNPENWNEDIKYKYGNSNSAIYSLNSSNKNIIRIEKVPSAENYKNQQLMVFDMAKNETKRYKLHNDETPFKGSLALFSAQNNDVFLITEYLTWQQLSFDTTKDFYFQKQKKYLFSDEEIKHDYYKPILQTYKTNVNAFLIVQNNFEDARDAFVINVDLKSGEVIAKKNIDEILKTLHITFNNNVSLYQLNYANNDSEYFVFSLKVDEKFYLFKTDKFLNDWKFILTDKDIAYDNFVLTLDNEIKLLKNDFSKLIIKSFDGNLSKKISETTLPIEDDKNDQNGYFYKNGKNTILFTTYNTTFAEGIKAVTFDENLKKIKEQCVYQRLPLEAQSFENSLHIFNISENNKNSITIFFKENDVLRFANIKP